MLCLFQTCKTIYTSPRSNVRILTTSKQSKTNIALKITNAIVPINNWNHKNTKTQKLQNWHVSFGTNITWIKLPTDEVNVTQVGCIPFQTAFRSSVSSWDVWGLHAQLSHNVKGFESWSVEKRSMNWLWKWQWSVTSFQNNGLTTSQWGTVQHPPREETSKSGVGWAGAIALTLQ